MEKQKKYALRKVAGYGLVSCAVGLMFVGSSTAHATPYNLDTPGLSEYETFENYGTPGEGQEFTIFDWTGTFKSDKGEQLRDDARLTVWYNRTVHAVDDSTTADPWVLEDRSPENMDDFNLEDHRFFDYGEPNTSTVGGNIFTIPGRIGDYYLVSADGNNVQHIGQNLEYTLKDNIYNEIGKQGQEVNRESNFVYRQKDTKITLRLVDADNPDKVYKSIDVPAFTNYEHNDLDTHVFDSFKSEGELLDNLPNEVALAHDGKTIDIRLKAKEEFTTTVKVKNENGDVLKEVQVTGKQDSTNSIDYGDLSEINKEYDTSKLPDTLIMNKDQTVVEYVVPARKDAYVDVVLKTAGDIVNIDDIDKIVTTVRYEGKVGDTVRFDNLKGKYYGSWTKPLAEVPEPIVLKDKNKNIIVVLEDDIREYSKSERLRPKVDYIGMTDHFTFEMIDNVYLNKFPMDKFYKLKSSTDKPEGTFYPGWSADTDVRDYPAKGTDFYIWAADKGKLEDVIKRVQSEIERLRHSQDDLGDLRAEDLLYGTPKTFDSHNNLVITYDYTPRTQEVTFKDLTINTPRTKIEIPILKDYDLYYIPEYNDADIGVNVMFWFTGDTSNLVKIENPLSFWNRPSDEKIKAVLDTHKNEKFASERDMYNALIKLMYTEDEIGLSDDLINKVFGNIESGMRFAYIPSEHTIHAKIVNERGEVLKDVPITGRGNDVVDIAWGSLSDLETLYDLSDIPTTHHIPLHDAQDIIFVAKKQTSENGTQTDNPDTSDSETQTKATIHVVYKNADGTVYKEFDVQADKGNILDASDLQMLPDDMDFTDDFMFYEVKGDGTDTIERAVKKQTSDNGTQTDKPDTSDNGTQTDKPDTSDNGTQTEVPNTSDDGTQTEAPNTSDNGTQTDNPSTSDNGTQTEVPNTSENGTQTEVPSTSDNGTQTEEPNTSDNGTQTEVPNTSDNGTQTEEPNTSENGTQTEEPNTSENGTQTEEPNTSENGTQTEVPNTSDNGTQTKTTIHVVYKNADGTIYKEFDVQSDKGSILDSSDLEMLSADMTFTDDFIFYKVKGDGHDVIERTVKKQTSENGIQTEEPNTSDNGTQTDTSDNGTQTDTSDNGTQTDTSDNGTQTDTSDNGTQTDTSDNGTQTDTSDNGTQTDTSDNGTQTDTSDNGTQTDTSDNGTQTDTSDNGTQTDKPNSSDNGTQTDKPDGKDGTQTDKPDGKDGTQTDKPDGKDGTQTDKPNTSDNGTQTDKDKSNANKQIKSTKSLPIVRESKTLPKTGTQATFTHMIGLVLMGMTSLFGFRKCKEE